MTEAKPAVIADIRTDPRIPQGAYEPTFVRSLAMVPLRRDDPVSALGAYWSSVKLIGKEKVELLQAVADAAALALLRFDFRLAHIADAEREDAAQRAPDAVLEPSASTSHPPSSAPQLGEC